jgi:hypothetical protein
MEELFLEASRNKLRFVTLKGQLTTEDLWDLPLNNLDTIAKGLRKQLNESAEESFIKAKSASNKEFETKLNIVRFVIDTIQIENEKKKIKIKTTEELNTLQSLLLDKRKEELKSLSSVELEALIESKRSEL